MLGFPSPGVVTRPPPRPQPLVAPSQETETPPSSPKAAEPVREHSLSVVTAQPLPTVETTPARTRYERIVARVADQELLTEPTALETEESDQFLLEDLYDDRASLGARVAGGLRALLVIAFASSPF